MHAYDAFRSLTHDGSDSRMRSLAARHIAQRESPSIRTAAFSASSAVPLRLSPSLGPSVCIHKICHSVGKGWGTRVGF